MNMLEKLILLNERIEELQRTITRTREERDLIQKCLMTALGALRDVVTEELVGEDAEKRLHIALDAIEVLCS